MSTRFTTVRPFLEAATGLVVAELAILLALRVIGPDASPMLAATLNAILLIGLGIPAAMWRLNARSRGAHPSGTRRSTSKGLALACGAIVVGGIAASVFAALRLERIAASEARARFDSLAESVLRTFEGQVDDSHGVLHGASSLYAASKIVDRDEFRAYVKSQHIAKKLPGALGVGFIERVERANLEGFVARTRAAGAEDFDVWAQPLPESEVASDVLFVVKYIEPLDANRPAWGYDMGSEGVRRDAIERAIRSGGPTITRRITLLQDAERRSGFLYLLPVYRGGDVPETEHGRVEALEGVIYAPVVLEATRDQVCKLAKGLLDLDVFDDESMAADTLLFDTDAGEGLDPDAVARSRFRRVSTIEMPGRTWTAVVRSMPTFDASINTWLAPVTGVTGSILSILVAVSFWGLSSARSRAEALAQAMTIDLQAACDRAERNFQDVRAFRSAIDASAIVSEADASGRIISVNDEFCKISGYARDELIGRNHRIVNSGFHPRHFWVGVWRQIASGKPWRGEVCNRAKDGSIYWVDSIIAPFTDASGKVERFISIRIDVTARKLAEQKLAESEELFRTLADSAPMLVWTSDTRANCNYINRPWTEFTGRSVDEALGDGWTKDLHPDDVARSTGTFLAAIQARTGFEMEYRYRRSDGVYRTFLSRGTPRFSGDGAFIGFVGACTDITELREAQSSAEAASRAKSAFLANMSHEIRTPLTAILGFADLLHDDPTNPRLADDRAGAVETIRAAGAHLMAILNDILDLSKIEADRMTVESVSTPIVEIIHEVADILRPRAAGKGVAMDVEFATPVPDQINTDPTRLRQILMNLVGNAVKFTEAGSVTMRVYVDHASAGDRFVVDVADTGPGMSPEQAARLFETFSQADETVTRRHGGTGLGLVIAKRLAKLMGGGVALVQTNPGVGTTFRVELPLCAASNATMVTTLRAAVSTATKLPGVAGKQLSGRIILAEDGPDNQRLIAFHLRKAGAEVDVADNGLIALERIRAAVAEGRPYDLLLSDMQMPELDGYSLASRLRSEGSTMPIVALTAHAMAEDRDKCLAAGCDDYATKPIDRNSLIETCVKWMIRSDSRSRLAA